MTTVLFVSHNIEKIKEMCSKVIWLERGKIVKQGPAKKICEEYMKTQGIKK